MHTNNNANLKHPTLASIAHHSTLLKIVKSTMIYGLNYYMLGISFEVFILISLVINL